MEINILAGNQEHKIPRHKTQTTYKAQSGYPLRYPYIHLCISIHPFMHISIYPCIHIYIYTLYIYINIHIWVAVLSLTISKFQAATQEPRLYISPPVAQVVAGFPRIGRIAQLFYRGRTHSTGKRWKEQHASHKKHHSWSILIYPTIFWPLLDKAFFAVSVLPGICIQNPWVPNSWSQIPRPVFNNKCHNTYE